MTLFRSLAALALAGTLLLAGCASPTLRLYEGAPRPAAEIAVIRMPEQLEVARINGQDIKGAKGSFNKGEKTLEVAPGRYELLIYYREIWELGGQHDVLRSNPVVFVVDARAGQTYRADYTRPRTYDAARQLAADFQGWTESPEGRQPSQASGLKFREGFMAQFSGSDDLVPDARGKVSSGGAQIVVPLTAEPPAAPTAPANATVTAAVPAKVRQDDRDWLSLMQGWWKQASADERRAFLRWVAEQP